MAEFKTQEVQVGELKVGDILVENGIQWHIDHVKKYSMTVRLDCSWNKTGEKPKSLNISRYWAKAQKKLRIAVDGHAEPCYDSDCECVFKEVEKRCFDCETGTTCWSHYLQRQGIPPGMSTWRIISPRYGR